MEKDTRVSKSCCTKKSLTSPSAAYPSSFEDPSLEASLEKIIRKLRATKSARDRCPAPFSQTGHISIIFDYIYLIANIEFVVLI